MLLCLLVIAHGLRHVAPLDQRIGQKPTGTDLAGQHTGLLGMAIGCIVIALGQSGSCQAIMSEGKIMIIVSHRGRLAGGLAKSHGLLRIAPNKRYDCQGDR